MRTPKMVPWFVTYHAMIACGSTRFCVQAFLDKAAVDKERARLAAENADLRTILQQYLDGISVNEAVMNNPTNPLLVINQRLQLTLAERNKLYTPSALQTVQPMSPTIKAVRPQLIEVNSYS